MELVNIVIDDETTTEHLEDEVPHIEGGQAGFPDTITAPPSLNMSTVSSTLSPVAKDETMPRSLVPNMVSHMPSSIVKLKHPRENMLGNINEGLRLQNRVVNQVSHSYYLSQLEPKKVNEALEDESWVADMRDELNQFVQNDVWTLVSRPKDHNIISTKWIFKNKFNEQGTVVRNKA